MEIDQLKYLIAITEHNNISKAAAQLHITQPALSRSMQKLEAELGTEIFTREKSKISINDFGLVVVEEAKKVLKQYDDMYQTINNYISNSNTISLASIGPAPLWFVGKVVSHINPTLNIEKNIVTNYETMLYNFNNYKYQGIILDYQINRPNISSFKLFSETLYIAVDKNHNLANKDKVSFSDIDGEDFLILDGTGIWYDTIKQAMPNATFLNQQDVNTYNKIVNASTIPTFRTDLTIPRFSKQENLIYIPITDEDATLTFYLNYYKNYIQLLDNIEGNMNVVNWDTYRIEDEYE